MHHTWVCSAISTLKLRASRLHYAWHAHRGHTWSMAAACMTSPRFISSCLISACCLAISRRTFATAHQHTLFLSAEFNIKSAPPLRCFTSLYCGYKTPCV